MPQQVGFAGQAGLAVARGLILNRLRKQAAARRGLTKVIGKSCAAGLPAGSRHRPEWGGAFLRFAANAAGLWLPTSSSGPAPRRLSCSLPTNRTAGEQPMKRVARNVLRGAAVEIITGAVTGHVRAETGRSLPPRSPTRR
ncbi:hypothetical protein [Haematobacter missouriensis]|nr:hypothetical protein [Haematobacter missouriensis]